jgi:uncharacterized protein YaeQ
MALKPVIYKVALNISDLNNHVYRTEHLTIALHPSETLQRMVARILAFALNVSDELAFTKGLSTVEEPDLWEKSLDDQIIRWIEMGEPAVDRVKKATRLAQHVKVYSYNSKSDVWWAQDKQKFMQLNADYLCFDSDAINNLAETVDRTMKWYVTVSDNTASINTDASDCDVSWTVLAGNSEQ